MKKILLVFALFLTGCSAERMNTYHCKRCNISDSTYLHTDTIVNIDTIETPQDSAIFQALIKCINGKPVIEKQVFINGRKTRVTVTQTDTLFLFRCDVDKEKVYSFTKSYVLREYNRRTKNFTIKRDVSNFEKFLMATGSVAILSGLVFIGVKIYKIFK